MIQPNIVEGVPSEESEILAAVEAFHESATPSARRQWIRTYLGPEAHQRSLELSRGRHGKKKLDRGESHVGQAGD